MTLLSEGAVRCAQGEGDVRAVRVFLAHMLGVSPVTSVGPQANLANNGKTHTYIHQPSNIANNSNIEHESCITLTVHSLLLSLLLKECSGSTPVVNPFLQIGEGKAMYTWSYLRVIRTKSTKSKPVIRIYVMRDET